MREEAVRTQADVLREDVETTRRAELQRQRAEMEREEHDEHTVAQNRLERGRLDEGLASVQDVAQLHAWLAARERQSQILRRKEQDALDKKRLAAKHENDSRSELALKRASAKVVEQHRERFLTEKRRTDERKADSELDDLVNARFASFRLTKA